MFSELQQQATAQVEAARRQSRASSRRGGRLASTASTATRSSTFALSATCRPCTPPLAPSSSSSSLLLDTARAIPTRRKTPRRRRGSGRGGTSAAPSQLRSTRSSLTRSGTFSSTSSSSGSVRNAIPPIQLLARPAGSIVDEPRIKSRSTSLTAHRRLPDNFPATPDQSQVPRSSIPFRPSFDFSQSRSSSNNHSSSDSPLQSDVQSQSRLDTARSQTNTSVREYQSTQLACAAAQLQSLLSINPTIPVLDILPPAVDSLIRRSSIATSSVTSKKSRPSQIDPAVQNYSSTQFASATAQLQSLLAAGSTIQLPVISNPIVDAIIHQSSASSQDGSGKSRRSPETPVSSSTKASDASSFAHTLLRRVKDRRLLRNSTKPPLHQRRKSDKVVQNVKVGSPAPEAAPVIVESTSVQVNPKAELHVPSLPPGFSSLNMPTYHTPFSARKALLRYPTAEERLRSRPAISARRSASRSRPEHSSRRSGSTTIRESPVSADIDTVRPGLSRLQFSNPISKPVRAIAENGSPITPGIGRSHRTSITRSRHLERQRINRNSTSPTGSDPTFQSRWLIRPGERYSNNNSSEDLYAEETPLKSARSRKFGVEATYNSPVIHQEETRTVTLTRAPPRPILPIRGQSGMRSFFRNTAFNVKVFRTSPITPNTKSSTGHTPTPEITISHHGSEDGIRSSNISNMTSVPLPPYFAHRGGHHHQESTNTSSPYSQISPGTLLKDSSPHDRMDIPDQSRSPSSQLSPFSSPRHRPRTRTRNRHRTRLETFADETESIEAAIVSEGPDLKVSDPALAVRFDSVTDLGETRMHIDTTTRQEGSIRRLKVDFATRHLPALRTRVSSVVVALRARSSTGTIRVPGDPSGQDHRNGSTFSSSKASFSGLSLRNIQSFESIRRLGSRLLHAGSYDSLVRRKFKSASVSTRRSVSEICNSIIGTEAVSACPAKQRPITAADLIVTSFHQTPFAQRYYDAQRTERQHIERLVEEAMRLPSATIDKSTEDDADDEDVDGIILGYERNVPDHLPQSPLCPLHPRHPSGGKAICPQHGHYRKRRHPVEPKKKLPSTAQSATQLPRRQFLHSPKTRHSAADLSPSPSNHRRTSYFRPGDFLTNDMLPQGRASLEYSDAPRPHLDALETTIQSPKITPAQIIEALPGTAQAIRPDSSSRPAPSPPRKLRHRVEIVLDSRDSPLDQHTLPPYQTRDRAWLRRSSNARMMVSATPPLRTRTTSTPDVLGLESFMAQRVPPPGHQRRFDRFGGDGIALGWDDWAYW